MIGFKSRMTNNGILPFVDRQKRKLRRSFTNPQKRHARSGLGERSEKIYRGIGFQPDNSIQKTTLRAAADRGGVPR